MAVERELKSVVNPNEMAPSGDIGSGAAKKRGAYVNISTKDKVVIREICQKMV